MTRHHFQALRRFRTSAILRMTPQPVMLIIMSVVLLMTAGCGDASTSPSAVDAASAPAQGATPVAGKVLDLEGQAVDPLQLDDSAVACHGAAPL